MALTIEQFILLQQILQNLSNLRKNMRENALEYKNSITVGKSFTEVKNVMLADANEYLRRLKWIADITINTTNKQKVDAMMTTLGLSSLELYSQYNELKKSAQATIDTSFISSIDITNCVDTILTDIKSELTLW